MSIVEEKYGMSHRSVENPEEPEKLCLAKHCAAKLQETSLNDLQLQDQIGLHHRLRFDADLVG